MQIMILLGSALCLSRAFFEYTGDEKVCEEVSALAQSVDRTGVALDDFRVFALGVRTISLRRKRGRVLLPK